MPWQSAPGPYVGVDCPGALNSIACDRLGIAVQLLRPAVRIDVLAEGRAVSMRTTSKYAPHAVRGTFWVGFLQPAGLLNGPLKIQPDEGRTYWVGRHPAFVSLRITAHYADGSVASVHERTPIRPGWG
ncbi:MAG TPA: hypothetical protein VNC40_02700 [Gaiellaceae bacterium]|nr:hypothetical protein [Gaiellaceae bacterium]